jgi:filamentous hemagglutinin family protein
MAIRNNVRALLNGSSVAVLALVLGTPLAVRAAGLPAHGQYVSGQGSINKANRSLTVKQSSTTGIIDWNRFSVGAKNGVSFDNGSGATLNRVTGGNLSRIAGSLHASGSLYLMNSSGVIVSGTGRVVTGGSFIASSGNISNDAFDGGRHKVLDARAAVINRGTIIAGGSARLIGSTVNESGRIHAANVTLRGHGGLIVSGYVVAHRANGAGGTIIATGRQIDVTGTISASGTKGGTVLIGGAHRTTVAAGAVIRTNAKTGAGGDIVIASDGTTTFDGKATARGMSEGGFVETSGRHVHVAGSARISTLASHGATGTWLIDPTDFVIAASGGDMSGATISDSLKTTDVLIQSSGGGSGSNGDVIVDDDISWSSGQMLTLDAYRNIDVNANIKITGAGVLTMIDADQTQTPGVVGVNDGHPADGDLVIGNGRIAFTDVTSGNNTQLSINGNAYTLENSVGDLASDIATNSGSGFYALADNYDASSDNGGAAYTASPIPTFFNGTFEGLGNTISNLTIDDATDSSVGLFAANFGEVRDIGLLNADVTATSASNGGGALIGDNDGTVENAFSFGSVGGSGTIGGLVGINSAIVTDSSSAASVTGSGNVGGLVGYNSGVINSSHATGTVVLGGSGGNVGGLVGNNNSGTTENSYATGAVTGAQNASIGGLVGFSNGTVSASYATGDVTGGDGADVGGLVGESRKDSSNSGVVSGSFASGTVIGDGGSVGGLVGCNCNGASITDSYATGIVTGTEDADVGGLVGLNDSGSTIDESYELGAVRASGDSVGALIGENDGTAGATKADYYNTTANTFVGAVGTGSLTAGGGISYANMQSTSSFNGWNFGTTGGGTGWVIVDQDGSLNNASGVGGTTPMALAEYSTTITNAHQLQLMELDPTADYTLANNIDAGGTAGGDVWGSQGFIAIGGNNASGLFTGTFDGASHAIANLTIDDSTNYYVGLFGESTGTIENAGLTNGNVTGSRVGANVGGLVGWNNGGGVVNSYADGAVTGGLDATVGGLVGFNSGAISQSYATGTVEGDTYAIVGGLVGNNVSDGTITQSYATGAVTDGGHGYVGGLLGVNAGAITQSYATGAVMGGFNADVGGFVGYNAGSGTIDESYALGAATIFSGANVGGFAGSNGGTLGGTTAVYYNSDANSEGDASTFTKGGGLTDAQMRDPSNFSSWTFGGLGSGANWVTVGSDGSVNGSGGTTPMLLSEYSTTITNAHQLQLMELDPTADYTLANNIDAGGTAGGDVWGSQGFIAVGGNAAANFSGTFDGHGHTISGLTINDSTNSDVGLFGVETGAISNVNLSNVSVQSSSAAQLGALVGDNDGGAVSDVSVSGLVSGSAAIVSVGGVAGYNEGSISNSQSSANIGATDDSSGAGAGGLVGFNNFGSITDSSASGAVTMNGDDVTAGGLVGVNGGSISQSFATGAVTLTDSITDSVNVAGGLVGTNDGGSIMQSYAMGAVQISGGATSLGGGLAGDNINSGTISQSFATGMVSAATVGGIAGLNDGTSTISSSYWDTETSGIPANGDPSGLTTAALQSALQTGFDNSVWNIVAGTSFPYLAWQFPTGAPKVVSGMAFSGINGAALAGLTFAASANGVEADVLSAASGANGYYYMLLAPGSISGSGTGVLVYGVGNSGAAFADNATDSISGLDIYNGYLHEVTSGGTYSGVVADLATAIGSNSAAQTAVSGLSNLAIDASSDFTIDSAIDLGSGTLVISDTVGSVNQSASITAAKLLLEGAANFTLGDTSNSISMLAMNGTGSLDFTNAGALTIGTVDSVSGINAGGGVGLTTTSGGISITQMLATNAHPLSLTSAGAITESGSGLIDASSLTGSSAGAVTLNGAGNDIADLGAFTAGGNFALTDDHDLTVDGTVNAGSHTVELKTTGSGHDVAIDAKVKGSTVDLISAAMISENGSGDIDATTLTGSSDGTVALTSSKNDFTDLGAFTTGGHHNLAVTDDHDLTTTGTINAGSDDIILTTTGSGHDIKIDSKLEASEVKFASAATISESSAGDIDAKTLTGSSKSAVALTSSKNAVTDLGAFSTGGHAFSLKDDHDLTTTGTVNTGSAALTLTTTGSGHDIFVKSKLEGGTVKLSSAATISESNAGAIDAKTLTGSSKGAVTLTSSKNVITGLGAFTTGGNAFSLTDDHDLTTTGTVNAGSRTVTLTTKGSGHDIAVDSKLEGGEVKLASAATISESNAGDIDAKTLTGSAKGTVKLTSAKNTITDLGALSTGSHAFALTDDHALTVDGKVNAGTGTLDLTTVGNNHDLAIEAAITAGTINLVTTGEATETSKGAITAKLLNVTADTGIDLTSKANKIKKLGTHKTKKGPNKVTL